MFLYSVVVEIIGLHQAGLLGGVLQPDLHLLLQKVDGGHGARPVGGYSHKVHLAEGLDMPGEVGHKDKGTPEDADQQRALSGVVGADLLPQLGHPLPLLLLLPVVHAERGGQEIGVGAAVHGDEHVVKHRLRLPQPDVLEGAGHAQLGDLVGRGARTWVYTPACSPL